MARVFADANVLFPFSVMDLLLTLAEDYVHDLVWSEHLLDEWQRVIVREGRRSTEAAALIAGHIRIGFSDSCVPEDQYKHLLAEIDGPDPDDVHHMAAAIAGNADTLITWNLDDFPAETLGRRGIAVTARPVSVRSARPATRGSAHHHRTYGPAQTAAADDRLRHHRRARTRRNPGLRPARTPHARRLTSARVVHTAHARRVHLPFPHTSYPSHDTVPAFVENRRLPTRGGIFDRGGPCPESVP